MTATMMGAAETALLELNKGSISQVIVESDESRIICLGAGERALLVLATSSDVQLENIRENLLSTREKLVSVLDQF